MQRKRFYYYAPGRRNRRFFYDRHTMLKRRTDNGTVNSLSISDLLKKQNYLCAICGKVMETYYDRSIDHILPLSKGGRHTINNIQITHRHCNVIKGDRAPWWVNWNYYCDELDKIKAKVNWRAGIAKKELAKFISQRYHSAIRKIDAQIKHYD